MLKIKLYFCLFLLSFALPVSLMAQTSQPDSANVIDDVVIQESAEIVLEEEKPPLKLTLDFSDVITIEDRITWTTLDHLPEIPDASQDDTFLRLNTDLARFRPTPVKVFKAKFRKVARWQLDITASDGRVFKTLVGQGNPPKRIEWDGSGDAGQFLNAGSAYSYRLTAFDRAGNKRTFPGEPFSVPAFYRIEDNRLTIGISGSELFSDDDLELSAAAEDYAREAATLIRYFSQKNEVSIETDLNEIAPFLRLLAKELILDVDNFLTVPPSARTQAAILVHAQ